MRKLSLNIVFSERSGFIGGIEEKYKSELNLLDDIYELGKSMSSGMTFSSNRQRLFEGILLFSSVRTVCAIESIVFLITLGNSADAALIFRSIFETLINILYIDKESDSRSLLFARHEVSDALRYFSRLMHPYIWLQQLPGDIVFPDAISNRIKYDHNTHQLLFDGPMTENDRVLLLGLSQDGAYQRAVDRLFRGSIKPGEVEGVTRNISSLKEQLMFYDSQIHSQFPGLEIPSGSTWSGKQLRQMAEDVDLGSEYDTMYWELSGITHFSASSSLFFLESDPIEKRLAPKFYPNDTISRRILHSSVDCSLGVLKLVNDRMGCGKGVVISQLQNRIARLFANPQQLGE